MIESSSCDVGTKGPKERSVASMYGWLLKLTVLLTTADQVSKFIAEALIKPYSTVATPLGELLRFTLIYNEGAAFGIMSGKQPFIMAITVVFAAGVLAYWRSIWNMGLFTRMAAAMMLSGSVGNFIDRARTGAVVDFLEVPIVPLFQVFNFADALLVLGTMVFIYSMFRAS